MKTAEEILNKHIAIDTDSEYKIGWMDTVLNSMKEYAKEVAKESLKNASENVKMKEGDRRPPLGSFDYIGTHYTAVDKQSIINESNIPNL